MQTKNFDICKKNIILLPLLIFISGCWKYSLSNFNQPPPYYYETWEKKEKTTFDIKKNLLECGFLSVYHDNDHDYKDIGLYDTDSIMNYYFMVSLCMEKLGYKEIKTGAGSTRISESCLDTENFPARKYYPACQPGFVAPEPTEDRRINGYYCNNAKRRYERCNDNTQDWTCGTNWFPLECYSDAQYEQYLKTKNPAYILNK